MVSCTCGWSLHCPVLLSVGQKVPQPPLSGRSRSAFTMTGLCLPWGRNCHAGVRPSRCVQMEACGSGWRESSAGSVSFCERARVSPVCSFRRFLALLSSCHIAVWVPVQSPLETHLPQPSTSAPVAVGPSEKGAESPWTEMGVSAKKAAAVQLFEIKCSQEKCRLIQISTALTVFPQK